MEINMTSISTECKNPNIIKRAIDATQQGLVSLYDVIAAGLDTCGRKAENLTHQYLPPTAAKIANYIIGALPVAAVWALTLVAPFYVSLPLAALYTLTILAKKSTLSTKAAINIENGNGVGFTLAAIDMLRYLKNAHIHPAITVSFIALEVIFAVVSFTKALQLIHADNKLLGEYEALSNSRPPSALLHK